jgi:hypothetical protein
MNRKQRRAAAKLGQTPRGETVAAMPPAGAADLLAAGLKLRR